MEQLNNKIDGAGGSQGSLPAEEWNQLPGEVQNVITALGQSLTSGDLDQLGKSIAGYVANGSFYTDSGSANAYSLSVVGSKQRAPAYADGFEIAFRAANDNTGASTVNVAGIGVKSIKDRLGADVAGGAISGLVSCVFDSANDWFEILPSGKVTDFLNTLRIDVASAATVDLGVDAPDTRNINITGTSTISAFNVSAGQLYFVRFDAAATLTDSASLVTQRGDDIVTAAGDTCLIRATATNIVEILCYTVALDGRFAGDYDVLLPLGYYSSGSYSLSGARTWADYDAIILCGSASVSAAPGNSWFGSREVLEALPTSWVGEVSTSGTAAIARITATSATQFTVSVVSDDRVRYVLGYRKAGVA